MIIKKKYTQINRQTQDENINEQSEQNSVSQVVPVSSESDAENISSQKQDNLNDEKNEQEEKNTFSFDLSIDDIKFEQRAERREGTRRRGYRRTQDRNIVSRAQKDAQSIKEAARQDGYKEGINQAQKEVELLRQKLSEFYNYKDAVFEKVSECIMDISVEIARKIINKEIETDKSSLISVIKSAVKEVNKTEDKITLRVMSKDVEIVKDKIPEIFADDYFEAKISVIPDNNIKEGGVVIETSNGIIDATIETQLAIIEKALKANSETTEDKIAQES